MKLDEFNIFRKYVEEIQVSLKSDKNSGYHVRRSVYISRSVLLRMKNSVPNERIFMKLDLVFSENLSRKFKCH